MPRGPNGLFIMINYRNIREGRGQSGQRKPSKLKPNKSGISVFFPLTPYQPPFLLLPGKG